MSPIEALKNNPFILAPMAGITDHAFRSFMKELGSSVVITELISANGIEYHSKKTIDLMSFDESQRPVGIQLFGEDPEVVARAAQFAESKGADFVDLNFGCPVPKVVKKGGGSAILRDLAAVQKMVSTVKKAIKIPLSIKIRTGWDSGTRNAVDVCRIAYEEGLMWVAIHGRTRAQGYEGFADWEYISEVKLKSQIPIIGNGDILNAHQAVKMMAASRVDGVMIGRGALKNPRIFIESLRQWQGLPVQKSDLSFSQLFVRLAHHIEAQCDEHISQIQLRKFAAWFATGYPGASSFRKAIFQSQSLPETMEKALAFFEAISVLENKEVVQEPFLMGGHG